MKALAFAAVVSLVAASCDDGTKPIDPVWGKQACASCAMLLSDPRFGAELTSEDGTRAFFDDPGCMATYVRERGVQPKAMWVHTSSGWVSARGARYAKGQASPMDFGFAPDEHGDATWADVEASAAARSSKETTR